MRGGNSAVSSRPEKTQQRRRGRPAAVMSAQEQPAVAGGKGVRLEAAESKLEDMAQNRTAKFGMADWAAEVEEVARIENLQAGSRNAEAFFGDDMTERGRGTGCRVLMRNVSSSFSNLEAFSAELQYASRMLADVMIYIDPGKVQDVQHLISSEAAKSPFHGQAQYVAGSRPGEGMVLVTRGPWRPAQNGAVKVWKHGGGRLARVEFEDTRGRTHIQGTDQQPRTRTDEGGHREHGPPKAELAIFAVYGYADKSERNKYKRLLHPGEMGGRAGLPAC